MGNKKKQIGFVILMLMVLLLAGWQGVSFIDLTTQVKGVLVVGNGGTGSSSAGTSGQIVRSNGSVLAAADDVRSVTYIQGSDSAAVVMANTDDQASFWRNNLGRTYKVAEVWCQADAGTPTVNVLKNTGSQVTLLSGGTCTCGTGAACTLTGTTADLNMASGDRLDYQTLTAGGTAKRVTVSIALAAQ